jgi:hypothetical protein
MLRARRMVVCLALVSALSVAGPWHPAAVAAAGVDPVLTATLDGRPIPLEEVGRHYCDDFSYPIIRCSSLALVAEARATLFLLLTSVDYVTIYDQSGYGGAYMHASQDYGVLALIGWNDRISSFRGRNNETGTFYTDWFYGGSWWTFCCNQQTASLGSYSNTFSSILRT